MSNNDPTGFRWLLWYVLFTIALAVFATVSTRAEAQEAPPKELGLLEAIGYAMMSGRFPPWWSIEDEWTTVTQGSRVYSCFVDRDTGQKWVSWGPRSILSVAVLSGRWRPGKFEPLTPDDWAVCGWEAPQAAGPVSLGEPAYWATYCVGYCDSGMIDWQKMNRPTNIAGFTVKGEACDAPVSGPPAGWHRLNRLIADGKDAVPVTRCE